MAEAQRWPRNGPEITADGGGASRARAVQEKGCGSSTKRRYWARGVSEWVRDLKKGVGRVGRWL
jgi:hypothetical protein